MKEKIAKLRDDTLVRNSFYLMLSTAVMAVLGFVFWFICARLFTPADIGVATTLISAMTLISYVSLLGFNSTFIRVLPTSKDRSTEINTGLLLATAAGVIIATIYVLLVPVIAPKLTILHQNIFYSLGFIALATFAALNLLTDSVFIAFRAAKYNLIIDGFIMSGIKLLLPFLFLGMGAYGVFAASGAAAAVACLASVIYLAAKFKYQPRLKIDIPTLRNVLHYSFNNYVANLLNIAPMLVLPIIVINALGADAAAYYYLASMIANLLYTVVFAVSQALFAEGSYQDRDGKELLRRAVIFLSAIMIPGTLFLYFAAHLLLSVYGGNYSTDATSILQVLALGAPAVTIYIMATVLLRISKQVYSLIAVNVVYLGLIAGLAIWWVGFGLSGVGYAWMAGHFVAGMLGVLLLTPPKRRSSSGPQPVQIEQ